MALAARFVAVDAPFLISLAKGDPACEAAVDLAAKMRLFISVPECAVKTILDICDSESDGEVKTAAEKAREALPVWGFHQDGMDDLQELYAEGAAKLIEARLEVTRAMARILAEVSVCRCLIFLSDDSELTNIESKKLEFILLSRDLPGFISIDPVMFGDFARLVLG